MLTKLSHQFPYTEQLFVRQINKHEQINPPERANLPTGRIITGVVEAQ
ncbi:hypothetical protein GQP67_000561 [Salmonella enterica]|nr:hypothetical protein [Salmonella enterica]